MIRARNWRQALTNGLIFAGILAAVVLAIPLVAALAFGLRIVLMVAIAGGVVALALSPRARRWLAREGEATLTYGGLRLPPEGWLDRTHSWIRRSEGGDLLVGIDDLAQRVLGEVEEVQLLPVGTRVERGEPLAILKHGRRTLAVKAPVGGVVRRVNGLVAARPGLVNEAPYGAGWTVALESTDLRRARKVLRRGNAARAWFRAEVDRLKAALAPSPMPVPTMQDGGELVADLPEHIDDATWEDVRRRFFE